MFLPHIFLPACVAAPVFQLGPVRTTRSAGLQTGPVPTGMSALRRVRPRSEVEGTNGKRRAGRFLVSALPLSFRFEVCFVRAGALKPRMNAVRVPP